MCDFCQKECSTKVRGFEKACITHRVNWFKNTCDVRSLSNRTSAEHLACGAGADGLATAHSLEKTTLVGPELVAMSSVAELERFFQLTRVTQRIQGQFFNLELVWFSYASNLDAKKGQTS